MPIERYDIVEVIVRGEASGQAVDNVFHYRAPDFVGAPNLGNFIDNFAGEWQTNILPQLTTEYTVLQYRGRVLGGMVWLGMSDTPATATRPAIRYKDSIVVDGTVLDVGTDAPPAHATQIAVSAEKVCGPLYTWAVDHDQSDDPVLLTLEKQVDGGVRLSSIAEDLSEAADQNRWTAAFVTAVGTALEAIRFVNTGAPSTAMQMCVLSKVKDKLPRTMPGFTLPSLAVALVESFSVMPFVSSQNTRKQSRAG